jgi:osmotically-inducible protein OsmY
MRSEYDRDYGRSYGSSGSGSQYGGSSYGSPREERNWWDKTTDEVSSWFGDDEAERRRRMDRMRGQHKGRGPKGYHRSDDRIKEDVSDRLSDDSFIDASEIDVSVQGGEVVLTGTVDDRNTKRRAEDIAESVSGVVNVENRIRVTKETSTFETSRTSGSTSGMGSSSTERGKTKQSNLVGETSNK